MVSKFTCVRCSSCSRCPALAPTCSGAGGREATEAGSRKRKKKDKDKKDKKHKDKGKKKKRRRSPSAAGEGPVQLSQHLGRDALYSSVSGHKVFGPLFYLPCADYVLPPMC